VNYGSKVVRRFFSVVRDDIRKGTPSERRQAKWVFVLSSLPILLINLWATFKNAEWAIKEPHNPFATFTIVASVVTLVFVSLLLAWLLRNMFYDEDGTPI